MQNREQEMQSFQEMMTRMNARMDRLKEEDTELKKMCAPYLFKQNKAEKLKRN